MKPIEAETTNCLRINAPQWYQRQDFLDWLNQPSTATWHRKGEPPSEYSDVFVTIDGEEGSDANGVSPDSIPEDIWREIVEAARRLGIDYGIVWLSNVE
jgi:hypothetical protein